jgi:hypothetical protein
MAERSHCDDETANYRRGFCDEKVTLNGRPASISGALLRFAIVSDNETGLACEFAWPTVERICNERDGKFFS